MDCTAAHIRRALHVCLLSILLIVVPPSAAGAQSTPGDLIRGRVTDPQGAPIAGARVTVPGAGSGVFTSQDGRFRLRLPGGTDQFLHLSAPGYQPLDVVALVPRQDSDDLVLVLERASYPLPGISVTGTTRSEIARVPGATSIVGSAVLHERAPLSVMDGLRTIPGIQTADEDPFGLNLNVGFRGLPPRRSSRTLLLEDGVPILLGPYGDPSMHYAPPIEAVERLEIVKGSSQIMSGPQTVGGVINFVTRRPPTGTEGSATLGGGALGYRNAHLRVGTGREGLGVAIDYTFREGEGVRREQGHRIHNAIVTGLLPVGTSQSLTVKGAFWSEASRISETGLTQSEFEANPFSLPFTAAGRFDVRRYLGQVVHEALWGRARLQTNAYISNTQRGSWRQSGESEERLGEDDYAEDFNCAPGATSYDQCGNQGRPREYTVMGIEPRLSIDLGRSGAASVIDLGARLYREDVRRRQFVGNTPTSREADASLTRDNEIATNVVAAFAHARIPAGAVTISPGLRIEHLAQDVRNRFPGMEAEFEQSYTQLLPGIGATYLPTDGTTLFAGVHRGFAPPRPADVYRPEPGQPVVLLDPETSWNWEVGARLEPTAGVRAEATFFRMDFGNQIIEAPAGSGQRFGNGGRTLHQGIEFGGLVSFGTLRRTLDDLTLSATYTFLPVARFESGDGRGDAIAGNRLPYAARHLASSSAAFAHRSGITITASMEHTGEQFADDENTMIPSDDGQDGILPSYSVVHTSASYALPGTRLQLRASIRNLFDEVYITQRNEGIYTGMRRLLRTEIQWSF